MQTRIVAFVKDPLSEPVKTRLGQDIGRQRAVEFYDLCLRLLCEQFSELSRIGFEVMIARSSEKPSARLTEIFGNLDSCLQGDGTIGDRLNTVDAEVRKKHCAEKVVFLGSDAPTLPNEIILAAIRATDDCDVALAPAIDGGFIVLACSRPLPPFGLAVRWSHKETMRDTLALLQRKHFTSVQTSSWHDVDEIGDFITLRDYLIRQRSLTGLQRQLLEFCLNCIAGVA